MKGNCMDLQETGIFKMGNTCEKQRMGKILCFGDIAGFLKAPVSDEKQMQAQAWSCWESWEGAFEELNSL